MKKQYITPAAETIAFATEGIMNNISKVKIDSESSGNAQYTNRPGSGSSLWGNEDNKGGLWE